MSKDTHETMTQGPIPRVLLSLALPTMGQHAYDLDLSNCDTFYVASLGTQATAAVGITFALNLVNSGRWLYAGNGRRQSHFFVPR